MLEVCERGEKGGFSKPRVLNVGINLSCIQMFVPQKLLKCANVNSVMKHQRCSGVSKLMGRIFRTVKPGCGNMLLYKRMDCRRADPCPARGEEEGVSVDRGDRAADEKIVVDSVDTGLI